MGVTGTAAWGGVAALCFLVLAVAYRAIAPGSVPLAALVGVAVLVGVVGAVGALVARD